MTDAHATAVSTVYFWLEYELGIDNPDHVELTMIIENGWLRYRCPAHDITPLEIARLEAACRHHAHSLEVHLNLEVQS